MTGLCLPTETEHQSYQRVLDEAWSVATERARRLPSWSDGTDEQRRRLLEREFQWAIPDIAQLEEIRRLGT